MTTATPVRLDLSQIPELTAESLEAMSLTDVEARLETCEMCESIARRNRDHDAALYYAEAVDVLHDELRSRRMLMRDAARNPMAAFALGASLCLPVR